MSWISPGIKVAMWSENPFDQAGLFCFQMKDSLRIYCSWNVNSQNFHSTVGILQEIFPWFIESSEWWFIDIH